MTRIVDAGNTVVPAYLSLVSNGFIVSRQESSTPNGKVERWTATRFGVELVADDVLRLLGLTSLYETRGPSWRATDDEIDDFLRHFGGDV